MPTIALVRLYISIRKCCKIKEKKYNLLDMSSLTFTSLSLIALSDVSLNKVILSTNASV